jgi:hypothetical protein
MPFLKEIQFVPSSYSSPVRVQRCRAICMRSHMLVFGGGHGELQDQVLRPSYLVCLGTTPPNRQGCGIRVSADVLRFMPHINVGTMWGPHALRDCERSARLCTSRTAGNRPHTRGGHGNVLPRFTGGQVVTGTNPVSPTQVRGTFRRCGRCPFSVPYANQDLPSTETQALFRETRGYSNIFPADIPRTEISPRMISAEGVRRRRKGHG